jgi:hypothetical protein
MADESPRSLVALRDARERVIAQLSDAFARDHLDVDDFEGRLTRAQRAESLAELEALVSDVAEPAQTSTALAPATPVTVAARVREQQTTVAIMGGVTRHGHWTAPRKLRVFALMGGAELDFREAALPAGVIDVQIVACMGGASLIVPPQLAVEMNGVALMGGFEHAERAPQVPDPDRPLLRVSGFVCMGGVSIETRLPGESEGDARRRRRQERKAHRARRRLESGSERLLPSGPRDPSDKAR